MNNPLGLKRNSCYLNEYYDTRLKNSVACFLLHVFYCIFLNFLGFAPNNVHFSNCTSLPPQPSP